MCTSTHRCFAFIRAFFALLSFTSCSTVLFAQINLVPNPSFEDTVSCPTYYTQINKSVGWSSYRLSPDYFNSCNNTFVGVPNNEPGFQYARTGNSYAGLFTYAKFGFNTREIIGIRLIQPLVTGATYFVSFYVCLAIGTIQHNNIITNRIGLKFFTDSFSVSNPVPIDNSADIFTDSLISDTLQWSLISGNFIADSAYEYIGIGNFFNDSLTTYVLLDSSAAFSYYYIDDIYLLKDTIIDNNQKIDFAASTKIYPNPASGYIIVEGAMRGNVQVVNCVGCILIDYTINPGKNTIDIRNLERGIYIVKVNNSNNYFFRKIVLIT